QGHDAAALAGPEPIERGVDQGGPRKETESHACGTGWTRTWTPASLRRERRPPPTWSRQGEPARTIWRRTPTRATSSPRQPAHAGGEFGEAGDPGGVAGDVGDLAPLAGAEAFQRQEDGVHGRLAEGSSGLAC